jgi:hypothetical protein
MKKHTGLLIGFTIVAAILIVSISINEITKNNLKRHTINVETNKNNIQNIVQPKENDDKKNALEEDNSFNENMVNTEPYEKISINRDLKIKSLKEFGLQDKHIKVLMLDIKARSPQIYYRDMRNLASSKLDDLVVVNKTGYEYKQFIDNNKVVRMVNEVMNSNFKDKDYILSVLHRWFIKDFSKCREEYDYFYKK